MRIEPPFFLTSSSVIHNPNPVPPMPFVEKRGSKIRFKVSASIPEPLSATLILAAFWPDGCKLTSRQRRIRRPPQRITSKAFAIRLNSTWRSSPSKKRNADAEQSLMTGAVCGAKESHAVSQFAVLNVADCAASG
jgi:hypothetical protein